MVNKSVSGAPALRVGIVGANAQRAWAHDAHLPALQQLPQFRLEAVSARSPELAEEARAAFGAGRAFGKSLELVRDPSIDIVAVTVKVPEHRAIVLAALAAGKNVYCEWPLGIDLDEAKELAAAVTPVSHVMIGLQALSSPAVLHARRLVQAGALGELKVLRVFSPFGGWGRKTTRFHAYLQDKKNGATLEAIGGGHTLAVVEHVVGPYLEVDARTSILQPTVELAGSDELVNRTCADHMLVLGRHEGGCISTVEVSGLEGKRPFLFELIGSKGTLTLTSTHPAGFQAGALHVETSVETTSAASSSVPQLVNAPVNVAESYLRFGADITTGARTVADFQYAVRLTRLLDAIGQASSSGIRQQVAHGD